MKRDDAIYFVVLFCLAFWLIMAIHFIPKSESFEGAQQSISDAV